MKQKRGMAYWKRELLLFLGITSIIASMILAVSPNFLTGYAVFGGEVVANQFRILAIALFIGGMVLVWTAADREEGEGELERRIGGAQREKPKIEIYSRRDPSRSDFVPERDIYIKEPGYLGFDYSLGEFEQKFRDLGSDELQEVMREDLGPGILELHNAGNRLARYVLDEMKIPVPEAPPVEGGARVIISRKALERARKDSSINGRARKFSSEIEMIRRDPVERPKERLGDFLVSPRGKGVSAAPRIAWGFDPNTNTVIIYDLLYHTDSKRYVDNWNDRASDGKIKRVDYERFGFEDYNGLD